MTPGDVLGRADAARKFHDVASLVGSEDSEFRRVSIALSVLAGIAAGDAICGRILGECSRGPDHRQAVALLRTVQGASDAAAALSRLLDEKDRAHYGSEAFSEPAVTGALRSSTALLAYMEAVLAR